MKCPDCTYEAASAAGLGAHRRTHGVVGHSKTTGWYRAHAEAPPQLACDRGDRDIIRKWIEHLASGTWSAQLRRSPTAVLNAVEAVAKEGFTK